LFTGLKPNKDGDPDNVQRKSWTIPLGPRLAGGENMPKILVTGATGNVGSRLVTQLVSRGASVRAFVRSGERAHFDARVEIATGDFADKGSLRKALEGVSRMYLLSAGANLDEYEAIAIDAAKAAGLELLVKHSALGAQYKAADFSRWHRAGEERIEASGLPYVFLRPAAFASNALFWASTIQTQDTAYGALGDASLPVIDPEDIAAVAAVVLTTPHAGKIYELSGPESLTSEQQVSILGSVLGRPLKYVNVPDSAARDSMLGMGLPPRYVDALVGLTQTLRNIGHIDPTGDVKAVLGRKPRTFGQWAEVNAAAFVAAQATSQDTRA
jgi:(4-alkanoyl-5-oxo-2,5-dihydrofuran-3-yl)methyl phosphate reductase